jgi:hypothetical protein
LRHGAERDSRSSDTAVVEHERGRRGDERILVALALTHFDVCRARAALERYAIGDDHLVASEPCFELGRFLGASELDAPGRGFGRRVALRQMQIHHTHAAATMRAHDLDDCIEARERDGRIRRMRRDARVGPAENRMALVEPVARRASAARHALVAAPR